MTALGWLQIILYCVIVVALVKPLGWYMTRVFNGERTLLSPILWPLAGFPRRASCQRAGAQFGARRRNEVNGWARPGTETTLVQSRLRGGH